MTQEPWDRIRQPTTGHAWLLRGSSVRRRSHFGLSSRGTACFMIEAFANYADVVAKAPALAGIELDFKEFGSPSPFGMTFELRENSDRSLFLLLCEDIARVAEAPESEAQAFHSLVNRLIRWQRLLARQRSQLLTPEEVRGLYAELVVLADLLTLAPGKQDQIVQCWDGPVDAAQDFRFTHFCVEVKATSPDRHGLVRISSEDQLHRTDRDIFLAVVNLRDEKDDPAALSLDELVETVSGRLDPETRQHFEERLGQAGYLDIDAYSSPRFKSSAPSLYAITPEAPVLHRGGIPSATSNLRYELDTRHLADQLVQHLPEIT